MSFSTVFTTILALAFAIAITPASAGGYKVGDLTIDGVWSRATAPAAPTGAGYMVITNTGSEPDRLIAASAPHAEMVELHESMMENNVMKMREVEGGIEIPAGATVTLEPGGLHVMFMRLKEPHKEGEDRTATLTFEKAGTIDVTFSVKGMGAGGHGHGHNHGS